jgi:hypothetical protein
MKMDVPASALRPSKLNRKVVLPPRPFDVHQDSRQQPSHAASGILEIAARNSSRRLAAEAARSARKPGSRGWPEV